MVSHPLWFLIQLCAGFLNQSQQQVIEFLIEENKVLRSKLGPKRLRFTDAERRRLAQKGKPLGRKLLRQYASLVHPDTILRWYRQLVANKYDGSDARGVGRPRLRKELEDLILRIARGAPAWGYRRIQGALRFVGHEISPNTVKRVLKDHGIDPAPERSKHETWKSFLESHFATLAACDFFTVEVLSFRGLIRYWVFFVLHLETRKVEIAGLTASPSGAWMMQVMRNLTDCETGFLKGKQKLIMDRDPLFTKEVQDCLRSVDVDPIRLPAKSPNLNAFAERFVRSIKSECLSRFVPLGERHLRVLLTAYESHYNAERPHQGIGNSLIEPTPRGEGTILRRDRLGGVLQHYYREAA